MLHTTVGSALSGASVLVHEYPMEEPLHPDTVLSGAHEDGTPVMTKVPPLLLPPLLPPPETAKPEVQQ